MINRPRQLKAVALAISVLTKVTPIIAQEQTEDTAWLPAVNVSGASSSESTESSRSYTAETIRSATRMDLTPRETPQSVSVITRERLDDQGSTTLDGALSMTTGIMVGQYDSQRTNFFSRGFSINNYQIDGLPRGINSPLQDTALWDRIEVVRGATGLMGSTGDPSASINMVRKRPTKEFQGSAALTLGRWDYRRLDADISAPLTEDGRIRGRAVVAQEDRNSYLDRYEEKKLVGMVILEADLTRDTLLTLGADYQRNKPQAATWGALPYWTSSGQLANFSRNTNFAPTWSSWENQQETFFTSVEHRFGGGWKLHAGYGHTTSKSAIKVGYASGYPNTADGSGMKVDTGLFGPGEYVNDNYDLYATGPFQFLGRTHTLIAGWNGGKQRYTSLGGTSVIPYSSTIADYRTYTADIAEPSFLLNGSRSVGDTWLTGGYTAVQWNITNAMHLITGARISNYKTQTENYNSTGSHTSTTGSLRVKNEVTPYLGLTWDLTPQISAYASYTTLFKPQSYKDRNEQYLEPVKGSSAEVGVKAELFGGALNASTALFQTKQSNIAELDGGITLSDGSQAYRATAAGITARGIEAEVSGAITRAWNVSAGYTYLNAETASGARAVPTQPKHLLQISTAYRFDGALAGLKVGASLRAQSGIYAVSTRGRPPEFSTTSEARIPQASYAVVDMMASYPISKSLVAQLNVTNLFDKHYYRNLGFYDSVLWGEPRNIKLTLRAVF
ncbi:TonB-dependent siderophore receptor [Comamonas testosteroni]|uniref:TonB-dependent siderophore receptor n=1 Tax=Comamonas testosteroni TaxID=285 RepID=UPI003899B17C